MSTAQLSPGTIVDVRFTIGAPTWARAGAQSYAATDDRGQAVVFTAYAPACFSSGLVLERSLRELRQLQTLQSPRVATVHACGKLADGGIYEVSAALPDTRLDGLVARGALPGPEAADIIEQVGEGLLEAQKAGVIHRNLGPRVVFVGPAGAVVTGFSVGEPHSDKSFGPLDTIAPEQVEGKVVDQRTLIYNLAALMHMLITGAPLFSGDAASQLPAHLGGEIPSDVHARLRRALGKDPRMRPMMLKQFLAELRAIGGGAARAPLAPSASGGAKAPPLPGGELSTGASAAKPGSAPSSRGWTMFMQGEGQGAAPVADAPGAAASVSDVPAKPKTRGWTMFMEGADESSAKPEDKPAPKPSTRGWTMFMEDDEAQAPPAVDAASLVAFEPTQVAPAPTADGAQPKTRGWTMFMEDDEANAASASTPAPASASGPASASAPAPAPASAYASGPASGAAPPAVGGPAAKPSTRGWTMFMKADEESAAEAVALAEPVAPQPAAPPSTPVAAPPMAVAPAPAATAPKSRGWTMFTEASEDEPTLAVDLSAAPATPPVEVEPALASEAPALEAPAITATPGSKSRRGDTDAPSKKRGWTMFMDKPLAEPKPKQDSLGGMVPASGESNAKGWTVFSPAADANAEPSGELQSDVDEPAVEWQPREPSGPRVVAAPPEAMAPAFDEAPASLATGSRASTSGQTTATIDDADARGQAAADGDRLRAKTLIVTGQPEAAVSVRPNTMITPPGSSPAAQPRMITVVTSEPPLGSPSAPPPGAVSSPVATGLSGPISTGMTGPISTSVSGPISTGMTGPISITTARQTGSDALVPAKKSSPVVLIVVGVSIVAAAIVGAIVMFN